MKYKILSIAVLFSILILMLICYNYFIKPSAPELSKNADNIKKDYYLVTQDSIKSKIDSMSLDKKVGQLLLAGFQGLEFDDNIKNFIDKYKPGGFILFQRNVKDTAQVRTLLKGLKDYNNSTNTIPLFLSVDEEGGRVSRLPADFKKLPSNGVIGIANSERLSQNIGEVLGDSLQSLGYNMNFAPVLDINSNPDNPIIGDRSFGSNPDLVSRLGIANMKGIQSKGIVSVVKHFPGHGDTSVDSHLGLPVVNNDLQRLNSFELVPFKKAIDEGAGGIMVAHILLPKIDNLNPASISKPIITDILRNQLGYDGMVITDDMTMGAIVKNYDIGDASVKSLQAGSDIILVCHNTDTMVYVIEKIKTAINTGTISMKDIDKKLLRILKTKERFKLSEENKLTVDINSINARINELLKDINH